MGSFVLAPFLTADRPLTADERTTLDAEPVWDMALLESNPPPPAAVVWTQSQPQAALAQTELAATWSNQ